MVSVVEKTALNRQASRQHMIRVATSHARLQLLFGPGWENGQFPAGLKLRSDLVQGQILGE